MSWLPLGVRLVWALFLLFAHLAICLFSERWVWGWYRLDWQCYTYGFVKNTIPKKNGLVVWVSISSSIQSWARVFVRDEPPYPPYPPLVTIYGRLHVSCVVYRHLGKLSWNDGWSVGCWSAGYTNGTTLDNELEIWALKSYVGAEGFVCIGSFSIVRPGVACI